MPSATEISRSSIYVKSSLAGLILTDKRLVLVNESSQVACVQSSIRSELSQGPAYRQSEREYFRCLKISRHARTVERLPLTISKPSMGISDEIPFSLKAYDGLPEVTG